MPSTPTRKQSAALAEQRSLAEYLRAWREELARKREKARIKAAKKRAKKAAKGKGPSRGVDRVPAHLRVSTPEHTFTPVSRDRRGRMVPHVNAKKDRALAGKARRNARKAERRAVAS